MVERKQYQQFTVNIQHILSVIEEKISLFKKRKLEVKRYLKSIHRSNSLPSASSMFILLDAEIQYAINKAIFHVLTILLQEVRENDQSIIKPNENEQSLQYEQLIRLLIIDTRFIEGFGKQISISTSEIAPVLLKVETLKFFLQVILNPDEEYQREQLSKYMQEHSYELLSVIFERIAVFDTNFLNNVNKLLQEHINKFKYS
ncbi:MAG: hypothetical protein ACTSXA_03950 [Candidatus Heimdallarchaeota archaeon]